MSACHFSPGTTSIHIVKPGIKVHGRYCREILVMQKPLPHIRQLSEFYVFRQHSVPANKVRETVALLTRDSRPHSSHDLAAKHPRLKSGGLQRVVSNAGEGLQRADQGHRQTVFAYPDSLGRTGSALY